jgi:hypothetical protein
LEWVLIVREVKSVPRTVANRNLVEQLTKHLIRITGAMDDPQDLHAIRYWPIVDEVFLEPWTHAFTNICQSWVTKAAYSTAAGKLFQELK